MIKPHICILASQYFGWGAYSGFGSMPRKLAGGLAALGFTSSGRWPLRLCVITVTGDRRRRCAQLRGPERRRTHPPRATE
jgi:hypothetical protein